MHIKNTKGHKTLIQIAYYKITAPNSSQSAAAHSLSSEFTLSHISTITKYCGWSICFHGENKNMLCVKAPLDNHVSGRNGQYNVCILFIMQIITNLFADAAPGVVEDCVLITRHGGVQLL